MEYMFWIILALTLFAVEAITLNLVTIWFALGAIGACIASLLGAGLYKQWIVFAVLSAVLLVFTKPIADRKLTVKKQATNADRVIGKTGIVTDDITPDKFAGTVKVDGKDWSAVSVSGEPIHRGETVSVQEIRGARLIVSPYKESKLHAE